MLQLITFVHWDSPFKVISLFVQGWTVITSELPATNFKGNLRQLYYGRKSRKAQFTPLDYIIQIFSLLRIIRNVIASLCPRFLGMWNNFASVTKHLYVSYSKFYETLILIIPLHPKQISVENFHHIVKLGSISQKILILIYDKEQL